MMENASTKESEEQRSTSIEKSEKTKKSKWRRRKRIILAKRVNRLIHELRKPKIKPK